MMMTTECQSNDCEYNEVGSTSKIYMILESAAGKCTSDIPVSLSNFKEKAIEKKKS
jgi:hypothetical protein